MCSTTIHVLLSKQAVLQGSIYLQDYAGVVLLFNTVKVVQAAVNAQLAIVLLMLCYIPTIFAIFANFQTVHCVTLRMYATLALEGTI
jgi:hypothetical protein